MAETNEIKEIKEEQEIIEGYEHPSSEDEGKEEFSHLTEEDLNADYEPQEETESTEASGEVSTEDIEEVATDSESEEALREEEAETDSSRKWDINGTTYTEEDMGTRMVKDYENLTSFSGKQSEKIGGYKQKIAELEEKLQAGNTTDAKPTEEETDSAPLKNEDYDIYTQDGMIAMAQDVARKEITRVREEVEEKNQEKVALDNSEKARDEFFSRHPEYSSEEEIVDLIQFGASKGIALGDATNKESITNYLETSHGLKTGDYGFFTNKDAASGQKESSSKAKAKTIDMVNEAKKVKPNLGNVNSSSTEIDYDNLTDDQWAKLPEEKRNELLEL